MYHYKEGNLNLAEEGPVYFLPLAYRERVSFMSKSQRKLKTSFCNRYCSVPPVCLPDTKIKYSFSIDGNNGKRER